MLLSKTEVYGGEDLALAAGGGRVGRTGDRLHLVFVGYGCWKHRFTLSSGCCVLSSHTYMFLVYDIHATLSDGE